MSWTTPSKIIWVGHPGGLPKIHDPLECHPSLVEVTDGELGLAPDYIPPCYTWENANKLRERVGSQWVYISPAADEGDDDTEAAAVEEAINEPVDVDTTPRDDRSWKAIHQSLVVASQLNTVPTYMTWSELVSWLRQARKTKAAQDAKDKTLFLFCWTSDPVVSMVRDVYHLVKQTYGTNARCYPNFRELQESELKIGDIQALDLVAAAFDDESLQYRPSTCFDTRGPCGLDLKSDAFVVKRTHSSCANGVHVEPLPMHLTLLPCQEKWVTEAKAGLKDGTRWFHQDYVESLKSWGEFRVLMSTLPGTLQKDGTRDGLRGRWGYIFDVVHTVQISSGAAVKRVLSKRTDELLDPRYGTCGNRTYKDLEDYVLATFEALRAFGRQDEVGMQSEAGKHAVNFKKGDMIAPSDSILALGSRKRKREEEPPPAKETSKSPKKVRKSPDGSSSPSRQSSRLQKLPDADTRTDADLRDFMFESLEAGVRLDIGISSAEMGHRFFVNEISREWYVDLFSFAAANPKTRFCTSLADARNDFFGLDEVAEDKDYAVSEEEMDDEEGENSRSARSETTDVARFSGGL